MKHIKALDGIRALAIIMVMFFHYNLLPLETLLPGAGQLQRLGQSGVTLFFVLSGFLITRILIFTKNNPHYFKNFYIRRTLRIFPLYYLFLLIFYFILPSFDLAKESSFNQEFPFYTFLQNIFMSFHWDTYGPTHYWSLAVEEHFYLFWPLIVWLVPTEKLDMPIYILIALAFINKVFMNVYGYNGFYFTLSRMDALCIGAFLSYKLYMYKYEYVVNWKMYRWLGIPFLGIYAVLWVFFSGDGNFLVQIFKDSGYYLIYYVLLLSVVSSNDNLIQNGIRKAFSNKLLIYIGKISFGLYVYHQICYQIIGKLNIESYSLSIILCLSLSIAIATLSFYCIENPILKYKDKFSYR